jgi:hypothetical protein
MIPVATSDQSGRFLMTTTRSKDYGDFIDKWENRVRYKGLHCVSQSKEESEHTYYTSMNARFP